MPDRQYLVLIVDEDGAVRDALQFALQTEGLDVRTYREGAELLADAEAARGACLIVADRMLTMNGFELLNRLRARDIRLPAILLTSHATAALCARAAAADVRLVLEKPLLDNALIDGILAILKNDVDPASSACLPYVDSRRTKPNIR